MNSMQLIQKEAIAQLRFIKEEALTDAAAIIRRSQDFGRALMLGNLEHGKVKIHFQDALHNRYQVETTIWAVTEDYLCLKGNLLIPICAIFEDE